MSEPVHLWATYNDIHNIIRATADKIASEFKPDMFVAIGGGGFLPARVLRTFLKDPSTAKTIPIKAIGLSLYEPLPGTTAEQCGTEMAMIVLNRGPDSGKTLLGRRVLIIDDVDATRKTLQYALSELQKDVESELQSLPESERDSKRTQFAIFVSIIRIEYPWQAIDIEEHDRLAKEDKEKRNDVFCSSV
ncbi:hypothetical protein AZE42_02675 [Rhizopogon vesiculosus]|uniref:Phosphoribosyltransferase domain-containing protein n=1 Tax=Rhizopogon vesiculosus TaxID=180088 RepID=A0A1J8QMK6_9AGAM|nr:hypothetical protein AZE42_02675 [Rhizopogon vesiculosus]